MSGTDGINIGDYHVNIDMVHHYYSCYCLFQAGDDDPIRKAVGDHATVLTQVTAFISLLDKENLKIYGKPFMVDHGWTGAQTDGIGRSVCAFFNYRWAEA